MTIIDALFEFHLKFWNTARIGIPVRSLLDRLLTGLTAQQKGTTARWYSNKTSLYILETFEIISIFLKWINELINKSSVPRMAHPLIGWVIIFLRNLNF